jgi:threonine dehydrogenase-like Zn-dependent dehydrogenase
VRGLFLDGGVVRYADDLPRPEPADGEARVRVLHAGICATDLALVRGYMGYRCVPGHEFVGEALDGPLAGERVVGEINAACGSCASCAAGNERHCPTRTVLGILGRAGAFAEELVLPARNLHRVPDGVSSEAATFTEPLAAAFEIPEQLDLSAARTALVVGDGRLGLLCAQVLALHGLDVALAGRHPERASLLARDVRPVGPLELGPGAASADERFDLVVEATGSPGVLQAALTRVRPRGTLLLKTTSEAPASLDLAPLVVDEIRLQGSRCGPFEPALAALAAGEVNVEPLIHARFPLHDGVRALERAAAPGTLKVLLTMPHA